MPVEAIPAGWAAPSNVRALTTTRKGGVSRGSYRSLNLGAHVGDEAEAVRANRARAAASLGIPAEPVWLAQVHGDHIVCADHPAARREADGSFTSTPGAVCAVLTADCLPLFLCDAEGTRVGLFHIGWRGLALGLVRKAARSFGDARQVLAWLGPAIGPDAFEIGADVKSALESRVDAPAGCFRPGGRGRWFADLYALTACALRREGVSCSYDDTLCTYSDPGRFFSHRRSGPCGRMASLIWMG